MESLGADGGFNCAGCEGAAAPQVEAKEPSRELEKSE